jgi:oxygen-dependent protoporphyrinogen oxidase
VSVAVVGGGITGLVAARDLAAAGVPVTLVEAGPRLGGKILTERFDGFLVESGPDSFLTTRPAAIELCRELGLGNRLIGTREPRAVFIRHRGRLVPLPEGLALVLPTRLRPFLTTPLFSPREKLRMGLDLFLPRATLDGDESVGAFLRRRLGNDLVERLAGPLLGGIYGTDVDQLSLLAVMPQLRAAEHAHRSLLLAGRAGSGAPRGPNGGSAGSLFQSLAGGMGELVDALRAALERGSRPANVRTSTVVEALEPIAGGHLVRLSDGSTVQAEAVVLAAPAPAAAQLLEARVPAAARALRTIPFGSTVAVTLGFPEDALPRPLRGHGFLVPPDEGLAISACTWSSAKWPGRAPEGFVLLRASLRAPDAALLAATDETLVAMARTDLARSLGLRGEPILARVARWPHAMPRYTIGHLDRVQAARAALAATPGIVLAGASYGGVGLPDCVAQGRAAAAQVLGWLAEGVGRRAEAGSAL